ncbi:unnamed protein product [Darwinula stevensoni]|uniref:Cap-specific mRNA (nucleoside-2'-O-)-methyltransferase 1 n=1 Tax=Darwinula stevensoni TaxID=69355 RepID=A0A7R8XJA0_9CRUS|nr:unnamed protein product [Darwinula stevensoni]CAG0894632.1 unnamed protein product [Darwinula stevensoni]
MSKPRTLSESSEEDNKDSHSMGATLWPVKRRGPSMAKHVGKSPKKRPRIDGNEESSNHETLSGYSKQSLGMMAKMGFKVGKGLGKEEQGRVDIIESSKQKGRRGLGLTVRGFEGTKADWNFSDEEITIEEEVTWMPTCILAPLSLSELRSWVEEGTKSLSLDGETAFCSPELLQEILSSKSIFDSLESAEMVRARSKANPFEAVGGGIFLNRAAMKMANMDAVFDHMFSNPKTPDGQPLVGKHNILYFADVCAGPGGFSEYLIWKRGPLYAKGYGFTLRGSCDFKLENFYAVSPEGFEPHYGKNGIDGTGDIFDESNLKTFRDFVMEQTGCGVHIVMADGGFSVEGQENIQEILSKRLYLCQFLCAMMILVPGGSFVCKLFDIFTPFSVGLIYLLYRSFHSVSIHKPNTSRPANSERYVICRNMRADSADVRDYLFELNCRLGELSKADTDIIEVVPLQFLQEDEGFFDYICNSNKKVGERQVLYLRKTQKFAQDDSLEEFRQLDLKSQCLKAWGVPEEIRKAPPKLPLDDVLVKLLGSDLKEYLEAVPKVLSAASISHDIHSVYNYRCVVLSSSSSNGDSQLGLIVGLGRSLVFMHCFGSRSQRWEKLSIKCQLPRETVIVAEIVTEFHGVASGSKRVQTIHIIDGIFLAGENIANRPLMERYCLCEQFAKIMNKPSNPTLAIIRAKEMFRLESVEQVFERLKRQKLKSYGERLVPVFSLSQTYPHVMVPRGLFLIPLVAHPWMMALSRSMNRKYYYNVMTRESVHEAPNDSINPVKSSLQDSWIWPLTNEGLCDPECDGLLDFVSRMRR